MARHHFTVTDPPPEPRAKPHSDAPSDASNEGPAVSLPASPAAPTDFSVRILKDGLFSGSRPLPRGEEFTAADIGAGTARRLLESGRAERVEGEGTGEEPVTAALDTPAAPFGEPPPPGAQSAAADVPVQPPATTEAPQAAAPAGDDDDSPQSPPRRGRGKQTSKKETD